MESVPREFQCCQESDKKSEEFKKVVELKTSGLSIYVHNDRNNMAEKKRSSAKQAEVFVLHNPNEKTIKRYDYISELCQYKTKCHQCKALIQRIRSAMDEISDINASEIRGLCQYCKRTNPTGKCKKCEFIANKFFCNRVKQFDERQIRIEEWFCKVRALLQAILESNIFCKHQVHQKTSFDEFNRLLKELDTPLTHHETGIRVSERLDRDNLMSNTKDMLENFLTKLKSQSDENLYSSDESKAATSCACKYFTHKQFDDSNLKPFATEESDAMNESSNLLLVSTKKSAEGGAELRTKKKSAKKEAGSKRVTSAKKNVIKISTSKPPKSDDKKQINPKRKIVNSVDDTLKLIMLAAKTKQKNQINILAPSEKLIKTTIKLPKIDNLPVPKAAETIIEIQLSDSTIELGKKHKGLQNTEMIKGIKIVPFDPHYKDEINLPNKPLLFKTEPTLGSPTIAKGTSISSLADDIKESSRIKPKTSISMPKGVIRYELSNHEFIDKGWTKLPTTKVMKKMNIYKMVPANQNNNWFSRHSDIDIQFYDTGEKLAEVYSSTRGSWYYKNGSLALDFYPAKEVNAGQRIVIYSNSCKEEGDVEKAIPVTVLASFDYLGNGVVYDHYGNIRLKYNQSEGILIDDKIGPPAQWKWHKLNEPPVLQTVFIETYNKDRDPNLEELMIRHKDNNKDEKLGRRLDEGVERNQEMLAIELENYVKDKSTKMYQSFKPFQIRMKTIKINNQFSLRILDQTNIYLLFSDGPISLKLSLGMKLISSEIIDSDTADVSQVASPYDRYPPRSKSIADIQEIIKRARKLGNLKGLALKQSI